MNQDTFTQYIFTTYSIEPDYPWAKYPDYAVFRHINNRKWFALLMHIPAAFLGQHDDETRMLDVVNLKAPPDLIDALRSQPGIYPAWHMDKIHWVSAALGEADDDPVRRLVEDSYRLTAK